MNKLEQAFYEHLKARTPSDWSIHPHGMTLLLANGLRYTPDLIVFRCDGTILAHEVKGFMRDDAAAKIKVAASVFPKIEFFLVSRDGRAGPWRIERVWP